MKSFLSGFDNLKNKIENVTSSLLEDKDTTKSINSLIIDLSQNNPSQSDLSTLDYYYTPYDLKDNPIVLIAVVSFHHKKGSIVEFTYPERENILSNNKTYFDELKGTNTTLNHSDILDGILSQLSCLCLPDGAHLINEDNQFFFIQDYHHLLYGISCYRQIRVTAAMKEDELENTRECVQKAMCVVSKLPLFGQLVSKLSIALSTFFEQESLKDKAIIAEVYNNYSNLSFTSLNINEVLVSFSLKKLFIFGQEKIFRLLKLLMLEKKILIYSHASNNVCSFIFSLLSLIPGNSFFNLSYGQNIKHYLDCYKHIGLPLKFLNNRNKVYPLFTLFDIEKASSCSSYLIGTTNPLFLNQNYLKYDCLINIDNGKITINKGINERLLKETSFEKNLYKRIISHCDTQNFENESWIVGETPFQSNYLGSDDHIRNEFKGYIVNFLVNMTLVINLLRDQTINGSIQLIDEVTLIDSSNEQGSNINDEERYRFYIRKILQNYNIHFIVAWIKTTNCGIWLREHNSNISDRSHYVKYAKNVVMFYENGDVFNGSMSQGLREGYGSWISHKGYTYEGNWKEDKKHGNGNLSNKDSYSFEGEWVNDKKEGYGKLINKGIKYTGGFKNDLYSGSGVLITPQNNILEGEFVEGILTGMGHAMEANGNNYVGLFNKGLYHGKGQLQSSDGCIYNGQFEQGKKSGEGFILLPNGDKYEGEFKDNTYNGRGVLTKKNGNVIEGNWINGVLAHKDESK